LAIRETCGQEIFKHMNAKGLRELQEEVLETGLCAYCGACAGACPYLVSYKGRIVILDNCTIPEPQCYKYCPRTDTDIGAVSQRGGSVASHIKISKKALYSSVTLEGKADVILGMEPVETLRALAEFGNPQVVVIVNPRPVYPSGDMPYPDLDELKELIIKFSSQTTFVRATEEALKMGDPLYANIILLGSLVGADLLPISRETMIPILEERFPGSLFDSNIKAFNRGIELGLKAFS